MYDHQNIDHTIAEANDIGTNTTVGAKAIGSQPFVVSELWATCTTAQATAVNVMTFTYQPIPGSATGATVLGTLTMPIGAAGRQVYKRIAPFQCAPGGQIIVTSDAGGTGGATVGVRGYPNWENPANNPAQIASA